MRVALLLALLAVPAWAGALDAKVLEHHGRWESGYGVEFYNVVGRLRNTSGHALRYVKLRIDALDARGKVVASTTTYNESAEGLAVPDLDPEGDRERHGGGERLRIRGGHAQGLDAGVSTTVTR